MVSHLSEIKIYWVSKLRWAILDKNSNIEQKYVIVLHNICIQGDEDEEGGGEGEGGGEEEAMDVSIELVYIE